MQVRDASEAELLEFASGMELLAQSTSATPVIATLFRQVAVGIRGTVEARARAVLWLEQSLDDPVRDVLMGEDGERAQESS